jgi:hypothetical protein
MSNDKLKQIFTSDAKNRKSVFCRWFLSVMILAALSLSISAQIQTNGTAYQIRNKAIAPNALPKVLDVKFGNDAPQTQVWQFNLNLSDSQTFKFVDIGNGVFNIVTKSNHFLSLKSVELVSDGGGSSNIPNESLIQDKKYVNSIACRVSAIGSCPDRQMWKLIPTGEPATFLIQNVRFPQKVLQPFDTGSQTAIILADINNADIQKWIIKQPKPNQVASQIGYGELQLDMSDFRFNDFFGSVQNKFFNSVGLFNTTAGGISFTDGKGDIDILCPQIRSVGETTALDKPKATYEILEGVVKDSDVAFADFPTSHFTHDFTFEVKPDPQYEYLLASGFFQKQNFTQSCAECKNLQTELQRQRNLLLHVFSPDAKAQAEAEIERISREIARKRCNSLNCQTTPFITLYDEYQDEIEVEWESGLAQNDAGDNPAVSENKKGNSFGFYSAGHKPKDVIWNWATVGDRVHVEGMWVWERGHPPVHTEIHPPHFVSVQRSLPVSFILNANGQNPIIRNDPRDSFIATRVDVFANADGNVYWNTKNLRPFIGAAPFAQVPDMKRKDYTFTIKHPFKKPNPTAKLAFQVIKQAVDNFPTNPIIRVLPNDDVQVTVPWMSSNVSNNAIFARTVLVYWDDSATKGVTADEKPKLYRVRIKEVNITDTKDTLLGGDFRIYCNVGSDWIFLNDFPVNSNFLGDGLGVARKGTYLINKFFKVYLPPDKSYRIKTAGWEADGLDKTMGKIINGYTREPLNIRRFVTDNLTRLADPDDEIGKIDISITNLAPRLGSNVLKEINPGGAFNIVTEIEEVR